MSTLVVRSARVVLADRMRPASILIADGRVAGIGEYDGQYGGVRELDARELVVLPGLVDTHVHVNDPGRTDWEGFEHATRAAAAGGVTTLVDMPLNSIPSTIDVDALEAKRRAADRRCHVDVGFWGGVVPGNEAALEPLVRAGVLGFKCFLSPSGVDEFPHVGEDNLRGALRVLARLHVPLLAHAEVPALLKDPDPASDPRRYTTWLDSRPPASEQAAIEMLVRLAREFGVQVHIVHLASAGALPAIAAARAAGAAVTVETCPHYLTFAADEIPDGATVFKCAPPIRAREHREALWQALAAGEIDLVATDHSPAPAQLKGCGSAGRGDFVKAWGGIASLQLGLAAVWTGAAARGLSVDCLARWLADASARLAGIDDRKGRIAVGRDADLVIWDPDAETVVDPFALHHRHPITPYAGMRLRGAVRTTILRGDIVVQDGELRGPAAGRFLTRRRTAA